MIARKIKEKGVPKFFCKNLSYSDRFAIFIIFLLFTLLSPHHSHSRSIVSGISTSEINIDTKFTGAEVLLFGAKGDAGDIIVNVRGPKKNFLVSKKDKFLGIWYNKDRLKFLDAYSYYSFFSSDNKEGKNNNFEQKLISKLEIGQDKINFNIKGSQTINQDKEFKIEFINKLEKQNLYLNRPDSVEFLDDTLFKVMLKFPKNVPTGVYTVEIYLVDKNNLIAFQAIPINVHQVGLSARINQFAYSQSIIYGIVTILMAVVAGFLANFVFSKLFNK